MKPYYYVYNQTQGRGPRVQHTTLAEAQAEALRLAGKHPGDTFEILKCLGIARTTEPSIFWNDGEGPPVAEPSPVDPGDGYRLLSEGETIQEGDEQFAADQWWELFPASGATVHAAATVRRKLPQVAADPYPTTPLPDGFDRWECRGRGWKPERSTYYITRNPRDEARSDGGWDSSHTYGKPFGYSALEYWEAVKNEAVEPTPESSDDDSYPTTPPNPGPGFRILEPGERVPRGAESYHYGRRTWTPLSPLRGWDGDTFDPEFDLWFRVPVRQTLQLRVGGRYRNRLGDVVTIEPDDTESPEWPFSGSDGRTYRPNGTQAISRRRDSSWDLVEEAVDEPEPIKLRLCGRYLDRRGQEVTIVGQRRGEWPFVGCNGSTYREDGTESGWADQESEHDLVREIVDREEVIQ